ncbi:hypothetical protein ACW9HJ_33110, partial [Nocardia gipuzkoensis]
MVSRTVLASRVFRVRLNRPRPSRVSLFRVSLCLVRVCRVSLSLVRVCRVVWWRRSRSRWGRVVRGG